MGICFVQMPQIVVIITGFTRHMLYKDYFAGEMGGGATTSCMMGVS